MTAIINESSNVSMAQANFQKNKLVATYIRTEKGVLTPLSSYGDMVWDYTPYFPHAARPHTDKVIKWEKTPSAWVESLKDVAFAFTHHKSPEGLRLDPASIPKRILTLNAFAKWCNAEGIFGFKKVRAFDLSRYIQKLRDEGCYDRTIAGHVALLRRVYDMRMHMDDSFDFEAMKVLGFDQLGALWEPEAARGRQTEVICLADASLILKAAVEHLETAYSILALRDELQESWERSRKHMSRNSWGASVKKPWVQKSGFRDSYDFESALADIRTAAYIVLALTTGCRVHELGDIRKGCIYSEMIDGEKYWWLNSTTRKIGSGPERWLAPKIAETAVHILEELTEPLRMKIFLELASARKSHDRVASVEEKAQVARHILELDRNSDRLFLSEADGKIVSTDTKSHNKQLSAFLTRKGVVLESPLRTHRFRRTYAVIMVHLNKGARVDMVTLQHHFKHSSLVMTEWYASLPDNDRELYELIGDEADLFDLELVEHWMDPSTPLAGGGFGEKLKAYPGRHHQPVFFKTRRDFLQTIRDDLNIRSTGHSWCLSEAQDCGGRGLFEPERCTRCGHGVIDDHFSDVWKNIRSQQAELIHLSDIGPGGRAKAQKCLSAAEVVLENFISGRKGIES